MTKIATKITKIPVDKFNDKKVQLASKIPLNKFTDKREQFTIS